MSDKSTYAIKMCCENCNIIVVLQVPFGRRTPEDGTCPICGCATLRHAWNTPAQESPMPNDLRKQIGDV